MTPSERERRIEAAAEMMAGLWGRITGGWTPLRRSLMTLAREALDAADEAVPMVPLADSPSGFAAGYLRQRERAEHAEKERDDWQSVYKNYRDDAEESIARAEAAAREFAEAAKDVVKVWREPPKIDSPTDLDSAIDELAIGLARHEQFARGDSDSGSMASTARPATTETPGGASRPHQPHNTRR